MALVNHGLRIRAGLVVLSVSLQITVHKLVVAQPPTAGIADKVDKGDKRIPRMAQQKPARPGQQLAAGLYRYQRPAGSPTEPPGGSSFARTGQSVKFNDHGFLNLTP